MDVLQILASFFPSGPSERVATDEDKKIETICNILRSLPVTATPEGIKTGIEQLYKDLPDGRMRTEDVVTHVLNKIAPGLAAGQSGPRYFGFVTGGALPAAQCGDILATIYDQNVQVHLPNDTISTALECRTLELVLDLLSVPRDLFGGRSLTTGATGSNILGLACGRDHAIKKVLDDPAYSVGDDGFPSGVHIRVITDRHHASIEKAAAIVGIGRKNVVELSALFPNSNASFADQLKEAFEENKKTDQKTAAKTGFIVVVGFAEVNTGDFTDLEGVRALCDQYCAWLHVDAAFGALACLLPEYSHISRYLKDADSITADAHKSFNTPYASGIFFTRSSASLTSILAGASIPAYLATPVSASQASSWLSSIPSPLHTNLENSRRFTALPLYCSILHMGRTGYRSLMERNVSFARDVVEWMTKGDGGQWYECLNLRDVVVSTNTGSYGRAEEKQAKRSIPFNVVLFRARSVEGVPAAYRRPIISEDLSDIPGDQDKARRDESTLSNTALIRDINATKRMYVSPGAYPGGAVRLAVSNWMTALDDNGTDLECVKEVLRSIMKGDGKCV